MADSGTVIAERLNPLTGRAHGPRPAQAPAAAAAQRRGRRRRRSTIRSPAPGSCACTGATTTRCASTTASRPCARRAGRTTVEDVSLFYGNLLPVHEGRPMTVHFHEPGPMLPGRRRPASCTASSSGRTGCARPLPDDGPLACLPSPLAWRRRRPRETAARSTLQRAGRRRQAGRRRPGTRSSRLVHSDDSPNRATTSWSRPTSGAQRAALRQRHQRPLLPRRRDRARAATRSAAGRPATSAPTSSHVRPLTGALAGACVACLESVRRHRRPRPRAGAEKIRRNAPEAYRARQLRAVTLADYVRRAEEVPGVVTRGRALRLDRQLAHRAGHDRSGRHHAMLDDAAAPRASPPTSRRCA